VSINKDDIKAFAKSCGMHLCGVSDVDRLATSDKGRHPCEILPGCKSVIVIGAKLLDGVIQANFRAFEDGRRDLKGLYGTYGYATLPNFELTYVCYSIARYIEDETGAAATPCSTGPMTNGAQISIRHAAVAAGLGVFGWMGLVLTPEFGPRNRFGVILTTLELEPDPMYEGPALCNPEKCGICTKACPTGALSKYGDEHYHVEIGGKPIDYCRLDWNKCQIGTYGLTKEFNGREDYVTTSEPTSADIFEAIAKMPVSVSGLQHTDSHNCGKCLSYCPAGKWGEHFKKTNLSKGISAE
jgi:epoxyqueuosine reductase QueG